MVWNQVCRNQVYVLNTSSLKINTSLINYDNKYPNGFSHLCVYAFVNGSREQIKLISRVLVEFTAKYETRYKNQIIKMY